ncbi:hypothetical protein O3G_MSEX001632 [Manduca sexta]|uniref:Uncharacterized protein n=1 Tax=Manduca sexta TaxID=7130 RepID=A0A921YKS6_MANSE|nr:hypothetical protein O3G_MSEX001632 [Manduca sexta]
MSIRHRCLVILLILASKVYGITNSNFNANIREYSVAGHDVSNATSIKTLQKDLERYASFAPANSPVNYKEVPDSVLSSTSHSRGLVHHEHPGYVISDYEDIPHYGHGYEYHVQEPHDYKYYDHYNGHHYSGHHDHGHGHHIDHGHGHHKHYDHALAAKTLLWPIAGIALLGAAAALVSNPVLLQLGVVSGRRRRDVDQVSGTEYIPNLKNIPDISAIREKLKQDDHENQFKKRMAKWNAFKEIKHRAITPFIQKSIARKDIPKVYNTEDSDDRFIPIPIKIKNN